MAAPKNVTMKDLSGKWVLNKTLSDDTDPVLQLQGIGYLARKAISWATVTLHVKQYVNPAGAVNIDIDQTATGGIKGTREERVLDWDQRSHTDHLFGDVVGRTRWTDVGTDGWEALDPYLKEGWLGEGEEGGPNGEKHVESWVENKKDGWTGEQIWGFAEVGGVRYYVRRVVVTRGAKTMRIRMVYDFISQ